MVSAVSSALLVLALVSSPGEAAVSSSASAPTPTLKSVQRLSSDLAKSRVSTDEGRRVAAEAELAELSDSVIGDGGAGIASRDALAYQMLGLGYSVRETADVIAERISRAALDHAHTLRLVGQAQAAATYLAAQYRRPSRAMVTAAIAEAAVVPVLAENVIGNAGLPRPSANAAIAPPGALHHANAARAVATVKPANAPVNAAPMSAEPVDAAILKYSRMHAVDAALVRAIVTTESAFDSDARSKGGAIGLMQLMPATARALGVNPHIADENIEGGVRYLSELLKMFGGVELALVAYNAGPGFASRYAKREVSLYGETRDYVRQVLAHLR